MSMVVSQECAERGCVAHDDRVDGPGVVIGHVVAAPPQRQPLTEEQLKPIADEYRILFGGWVVDFARAIERKHGIGGKHD